MSLDEILRDLKETALGENHRFWFEICKNDAKILYEYLKKSGGNTNE